MMGAARRKREFLFLQGPPGPFFRLLGKKLEEQGAGVHRINLCGGDRYDWRDGATDYRGRMRNWPLFFDRYVQDREITDLVLYGDCRPVHQSALGLAKLRGVRVHVFEEGYIRPDWMTLERDGVNGYSTFARDPAVIMAAGEWLAPVPQLPPITAAFRRRARDSYWHYHHVWFGRVRFPFYRSHRSGSVIVEGMGWLLHFARARQRERQAEQVLKRIAGRKYFLFPLQLSGDYQIRAHSPFPSMPVAAEYVLESFARHAPADTCLVMKEHPLDCGFLDWRRFIAVRARRLGVADRVLHIGGGDLKQLSENSAGMVCVNSTSGTLALEVGIPVIVLGDAVYDVPGITHGGGLDSFWSAPEPPNRELYVAFKKLLQNDCLVRGGLASESAIQILLRSSVERLLTEEPVSRVERAALASAQELGTRPESSR
jgi:capsular polysaccharide export protein